jgi:hypothetical protein
MFGKLINGTALLPKLSKIVSRRNGNESSFANWYSTYKKYRFVCSNTTWPVSITVILNLLGQYSGIGVKLNVQKSFGFDLKL